MDDSLAERKTTETIGAYDLAEEIGRGGMALVLRGCDRRLNRDMAVKVLLERYRDRPDLIRRFVEEAQITGQLQHPYIIPVHELGMLPDGRPFFAMKLVKGRTFADLLAERPNPAHDLQRFLQVFEQVCQTIAYAHSKGIIHRDLKPANVMVGAFGEVQVMDWGLAKVLDEAHPGPKSDSETSLETICDESKFRNTQTGDVLGTFAFMPPEQAAGIVERIDRGSDVFGLGAILCNVLTGQPPYVGDSVQVRQQAHAGQTTQAIEKLDECGADAALISLAKQCLATNAEDRPADASAIVDAMATYFTAVQERLRTAEIARAKAETETVEQRKQAVLAEAKAEAEEKRARAEKRRRRATMVMAASLLLLITGAAAFGLLMLRQRADRAAEMASRRADTERDVTAALREAVLLHEEGVKQADDPERWRQTLAVALSAVKRAEDALSLGEATDALRGKVAAVRTLVTDDDRDCKLLADLERVLDDWQGAMDQRFAGAGAAKRYENIFGEYGIDMKNGAIDEIAARLRAHRFRPQLLEAIEKWAAGIAERWDERKLIVNPEKTGVFGVPSLNWKQSDRLLRILDATNPDPNSFRLRWRTARSQGNSQALIQLADAPEALTLTPVGMANLSYDLQVVGCANHAVGLLRKGYAKHRNSYILCYWLGGALLICEPPKTEEAIRLLTAAAALRSQTPVSFRRLSQALKDNREFSAAIREAQHAVELDKTSADAHHHLGIVYQDQDAATAIACYREALRLDPGSIVARVALAEIFLKEDKVAEALKLILEVEKLGPASPATQLLLGDARLANGETAAAIACYRKAVTIAPVFGHARISLASALARDDLSAAIKLLEEGILITPFYQDFYPLLANWYMIRGNVDDALRTIRRPAELAPKSAHAQVQLCNFMLTAGKSADALAAARTAHELDPSWSQSHVALIRAYLKNGDLDRALLAGKEAVSRFPDDAAMHDKLGTVYYWRCEFAKSLDQHRQAIKLGPSNGVYQENLGLVLRAQGNLLEAVEAFKAGIELRKKESEVYHLLAESYGVLGRSEEAIATALEAIDLKNRYNSQAYVMIIQCQVQKNEYHKAMKTVQRLQATLSPSDSSQGALRVMLTTLEYSEKCRKELPAIFAGKKKPTTAKENLTYGILCSQFHQERHSLDAVRFFKAAFAVEPRFASDTSMRPRVSAAICAVRAATQRSSDGANLDDGASESLRREALDWLRAEFASLEKGVTRNPLQRAPLQWTLRKWQQEPALAGVRDLPDLLAITTAERMEWIALWEDVATLRKKAAE